MKWRALKQKEVLKMTLKQYLDEWLDEYKYQIAPNTLRGYKVNINHLCMYMGDIELQELTYKDIQQCYNKLLNNLSGTSVLYCHRVLRHALHQAELRDIISRNPCDLVYAPKKSRIHFNVLNDDELKRLLNAVKGTWLYPPVMLSALLGLRRGEVLALRWSDIDFKNNILTVSYSALTLNGEFTLRELKTAKSYRSILLSDTLSDYLYTLMSISNSKYICTRYGQPISPNVLNKYFRRTVYNLKIPYVRFHDLRHTNATLLLKKGIPAKIVSERLGHSSITITLDTYSHVLVDMQKDSSVALDDLI